MPLSPLEVRQFLLPSAKVRGYDRAATDEFVQRVGAAYEAVWTEREELTKQLAKLEAELAAGQEDERHLTEKLMAMGEQAARTRAALEQVDSLSRQVEESAQKLRDAARMETDLQERIVSLESELAAHRKREAVVGETLILAESSAAQIRAAAHRDVDAVRGEAEAAAGEVRSAAERDAQAIVSEARTMSRQIEEEAARARELHEAERERMKQIEDETRHNLSSLLIDTLNRAGIDTHQIEGLEALRRGYE